MLSVNEKNCYITWKTDIELKIIEKCLIDRIWLTK